MDWVKTKEEFIASQQTIKEFADSHGISLSTLKKKAAAGGWVEERNQFGTQVAQKVRKKNLAKAVDKRAKVEGLWDKLAAATEKYLDRQGATAKPSDLEHCANAIEKLQKGMGIMPELVEEEHRVRIDKMRKEIETAGAEKDDIVIDLGGAAAWAK